MATLKIWHIGDTHGNHNTLKIPDVDLIIHSGDATNYRNAGANYEELLDFLRWFKNIDIPKIYVAGNHDTSIEAGWVTKEDLKKDGIMYLEHESIEYEGLKIFGSPYTPAFGNWAFNIKRSKLNKYWERVPEDTDLLITHGPPMGVLDLTENPDGSLEMCGCSALYKQVTKCIKPKLHMFGHIHNRRGARYNNVGTKTVPECDTLFSNAAISIDGKINSIYHNGNILHV